MNNSSPTICVVGSSNIDQIAYTDRVPKRGETLIGKSYVMGFGGKGANQAVMAGILGANTYMITCLGDDVYADMTIENYKKCNVNIDYIQRVSGSSGVAPIWVEEDGTNRIIVISGANDLLDAESAISSMRSIQNLSVVVGQFEIPQNVTSEVFSYCKKNNIQTVLNPAPAQELDQDILDVTDWFIPNEVEFNFLSKGGDSNNDSDVLSFASDIPSNLIITLGAHGSAIVKKNKVVRFPAPEADVIDTTGAGDAFVGALAYGIACGLDIIESIQLGMDKASDSVTRKGTQSSFK